ncbi:hypothetical protein LEP1GSC104_0829 [Leptospira interrogans str. UI 12621]|uniref:Uncharacterized protein n=1 Tax=Leptospira interrogans str. UI 12621 TaxID=1049937 RepID=A0A0F6HC36_LEPIR|nr:hypothetical protein LEP1GSC104_0829 [Leptospira interrogans str. UI 12621]
MTFLRCRSFELPPKNGQGYEVTFLQLKQKLKSIPKIRF